MTEAAVSERGDEPQPAVFPTPQLNPNNLERKAIAAAVYKTLEPNLLAYDQATGQILGPVSDSAKPAADVAPEPAPAAAPAPAVAPAAQPQTAKLSLGGVETEVPIAVKEAIDARLREADRFRQDYERRLNERKPEPDLSNVVQLIKDAPFDDGAAKQLAEVLNPQRAVQRVDEQTSHIEARIEGRATARQFQSQHQDIFGDQNLTALFFTKDRELADAGDTRPLGERWSAIAQDVRGWWGAKPALTPDPPAVLEDKAARKLGIANPPSASGARVPAAEALKPRTTEDILAGMAKARHQKFET